MFLQIMLHYFKGPVCLLNAWTGAHLGLLYKLSGPVIGQDEPGSHLGHHSSGALWNTYLKKIIPYLQTQDYAML